MSFPKYSLSMLHIMSNTTATTGKILFSAEGHYALCISSIFLPVKLFLVAGGTVISKHLSYQQKHKGIIQLFQLFFTSTWTPVLPRSPVLFLEGIDQDLLLCELLLPFLLHAQHFRRLLLASGSWEVKKNGEEFRDESLM